MALLRKGDKGPEVETIQALLNKAGYGPLVTDGDFGPHTDGAVRAFQEAHGLAADGIVGPLTQAALANTVPAYAYPGATPPPDHPEAALYKAHSYHELYTMFGDPMQAGWDAANLTKITAPQPQIGTFTINQAIAPVTLRALQKIEADGYSSELLSCAGWLCKRYVRGSGSVLSLHSWALAGDFNVPQNPLDVRHSGPGTRGAFYPDHPVILIFKSFGFDWGGDFKHRADEMHICWGPF